MVNRVVCASINQSVANLCSPSLIVTYHEGAVCASYVQLYSSVFSLLQKPVDVRVESQTVSGSE